MPPERPKRDYPPCALSGEPISDILTAIADPETGQPSNLESVIEKLEKTEPLGPNERVAYIGRGEFGVVEETGDKKKNKSVVIKRRIEYENPNQQHEWRKELSPGISRDYLPDPQPLSDLYDDEEERTFPRFGRISR
ncbi:MAG: hypothetical protein GVY29_12390 [Spirochaetes bacterium]|jgi:hypothetical protein|nr:hypothetical protein [Spirochaetota bacterium]